MSDPKDFTMWSTGYSCSRAYVLTLSLVCHQNIYLALQMRALESQKFKDDPFSSGHFTDEKTRVEEM